MMDGFEYRLRDKLKGIRTLGCGARKERIAILGSGIVPKFDHAAGLTMGRYEGSGFWGSAPLGKPKPEG
jgi:hypothetical protein